jgi:16S rRNA (adenine1518-N6/adenine1519-N6)-dimethyltransferase
LSSFGTKRSYPRKHLGQNYLVDENISKKIVNSFSPKPDEIILEIGPGKGALTKFLVKQNKNLIAVELDRNNYESLRKSFTELILINDDILKISFRDTLKNCGQTSKSGKLRVIGNIPYNITSDILFKLIDERESITDAQIMMQEEVAQRLTAKPNTKVYGILSVMLQTYAQPEFLFKVSANCFYPKPKVDSRVVRIGFHNKLEHKIINRDFYRKFVRTAFGTRRKTLRNSLKNLGIKINELEYDFDFNRRAESLSVEEFIDLSNKIYDNILRT